MGATMERRELLKYGVTGLAGLGTGYVLLDRSTDTAQAAISVGSLSISDAETTTQDGTISGVRVDVGGSWEYDLPAGKNPDTWKTTLSVTDGENVETVGKATGGAKYLMNNGDYSITGSITDTDIYTPADFKAPEGKRKNVTMGFVLVFEVLNGSDELLASATLDDTGTVSVTNEAYNSSDYGQLGGSGELIIDE